MADYDATSIDHLIRRGAGEHNPLLTFKWICTMLPFGLDPTYVESIELNFSNIEVSDGWHGAGTMSYFPGFSNIAAFGLTLYEDSAASTLQWIYNWKNLVKVVYPDSGKDFASGAYNLPKNYKRDMEFKLLATDNSEVVKITLCSVWPSDTGALSLDYSQSDRVKITQTFSCDDQKIVFLKKAITGSFSEAIDASQPVAKGEYVDTYKGGGSSPISRTLGKIPKAFLETAQRAAGQF